MNPGNAESREMLRESGHASVEALFCAHGAVAPGAETTPLAAALPEQAQRLRLRRFAAQVTPASRLISFLGAGTYDRYLPAAVEAVAWAPVDDCDEAVRLSRRFAARLAALTGLPQVAPRALTFFELAEALAREVMAARPGRTTVALAATFPPALAERLRQAFARAGLACRMLPEGEGITLPAEVDAATAAVIVASPNRHGCLEPLGPLAEAARKHGALFAVAADPVSLALVHPPGDGGADFCCGDLRSLGLSDRTTGEAWFLAGSGGPLAVEDRQAGPEVRRVVAFLDRVGAEGLRDYAWASYKNAHYVHRAIGQITGFRAAFPAPFFNEFVIETPLPAAEIAAELEEQGIAAGIPLPATGGRADRLLVAVTESRTQSEVEYFLRALKQLRDRNSGRILGVDS
jgi:glycine dehydrogenase subunit 1